MDSVKKIVVILNSIVILMAYAGIFPPVGSYASDGPVAAGFMDLESSIKALRLKVEKAQRSVVLIIAYDDSGSEIRRGNGIFIDGEGRIMTNAFTMKNVYSAEVFSGSNRYPAVVLLNNSEDIDIALIQVKANNEIPLELDFQTEMKQGERIIAVGRSIVFQLTVSEGLISKVTGIGEKADFLEIETVAGLLSYQPSKEGPVINMDGKVIGFLTTAIINSRNEIVFPEVSYGDKLNAVRVRTIKHMAENQDDMEYYQTARSRVWHRWLVRKIESAAVSAFTVLFNLGFMAIMAIVFALLLIVAVIHSLYSKLRKKLNK